MMSARWFRLILLISLLVLKAEAATTTKGTIKEEQPKLFGIIPIPQWLISAKIFLQNAVSSVKNFFTSEKLLSLDIFGHSVDLQRPKLPQDKDQLQRRGQRFKHSLKGDAGTRVLFAIYMNIAAIIAVYSYLFIRQIMVTIRSYRKQPQEAAEPKRKTISVAPSSYRPPHFNKADVEMGNSDTEWDPIDPLAEPQALNMRQRKTVTSTRTTNKKNALHRDTSMESLSNSLFDQDLTQMDSIQPSSSDHIYVDGYEPLPKDGRRGQLIHMPGSFNS